ncbi:MAG: hypothetical protein ACREA1_01395, partial [Nitrosotalea sp.]
AVSAWGINSGSGGATPEYNPSPQNMSGRQLDVDIKNLQDLFNQDYNGTTRSMTFRLCDTNGDNTIPNTTYRIIVTKDDNHDVVLDNMFYSNPGLLELQIQNSSTTSIASYTKYDSNLNDTFAADSNGTVYLQSPFLWKPGQYHIVVKILGYETKGMISQNNEPTFNYTTDVPDIIRPDVLYNNNTYKIKILSTDKIRDFTYDPSEMRLSWLIPVTKNELLTRANQMFSHVEIPKSFQEFSRSPFLNMTINDIPIQSPYADTQSSHADILADLLFSGSFLPSLVDYPNSTIIPVTFSVSPVTKSSSHIVLSHGVQALISWSTDPPVAGKNSTASIKFFANGTLLQNVVYDIYLEQKPGEYLENKDSVVAKDGTDYEEFSFPKNSVYQVYLHVRGLHNSSAPHSIDNALDSDAYGYVVTQNFANYSKLPSYDNSKVTKIIYLDDFKKTIASKYAHTDDWRHIVTLRSLGWSQDNKTIIIKTNNNFAGPNLWSIGMDGTGLHSVLPNDTILKDMRYPTNQLDNMIVSVPQQSEVPSFNIVIETVDKNYQQILYAGDTSPELPAISSDGQYVAFALDASGA